MLGVSAYLGLSTPYVFTAFVLGLVDFFIFLLLLEYTYKLGRGVAKENSEAFFYSLPSVWGTKIYSLHHSVLVSVFTMAVIGMFWVLVLNFTSLTEFVIPVNEAVAFSAFCILGLLSLYCLDNK